MIMTIGETLRALREESRRPLTQAELGEKLNLSQRAVSRLETDQAHLSDETLKAYCLYYHVSADYILGLPEGLPYPKR